SWGFGLAGIFMFLGMMQFWLAKDLFGSVGAKPTKVYEVELPQNINEESPAEDEEAQVDEKLNPFTKFDYLLIVLSAVGGLLYLFNDPLEKIGEINLLPFSIGNLGGSNVIVLAALVLFLILMVSRVSRYIPIVRDRIIAVAIFGLFTVFFFAAFEQSLGSMTLFARDYTNRELIGNSAMVFKIVDALLTTVPLIIITWVLYLLFKKTYDRIGWSNIVLAIAFVGVWGLVIYRLNDKLTTDAAQIDASWFGILNSFFIISLAPFFSRWWESKYNPSAAMKYGLGLILLGLGFAVLAYGTQDIPQGAKTAAVSMIFLVLAYLLHTMGELCLSPVGLSYLSKLVPARMIGFMFGIWYLAIAIGQKAAGTMGGMIDRISEQYSLSTFFLIFTLIPIGVGMLSILLNPVLKRLMHGVR
ncbi:MAG: MFS transporter, partial [Bacteroidia bacterium]|nr:MFS transporter [Bacteroidia bacterium]